MRRPRPCLPVVFATVVYLACFGIARAQSSATLRFPQPEVVLTKLSPVIVPQLARMANIVGEVNIQVGIRKDGSIASAELVNGHPMLELAALESARKSQFECHGCDETVTPYVLTYTFEIRDDGSCCDSLGKVPEVTQNQAHITIVSAQMCICDPASILTRRVRSAKCFYLWKCGLSDH